MQRMKPRFRKVGPPTTQPPDHDPVLDPVYVAVHRELAQWGGDFTLVGQHVCRTCTIVGFSLRNGVFRTAWWTQECERLKLAAQKEETYPESHGLPYVAPLKIDLKKLPVFANQMDDPAWRFKYESKSANVSLATVEDNLRFVFQEDGFEHHRRSKHRSWWWRRGYDPDHYGVTIPWLEASR